MLKIGWDMIKWSCCIIERQSRFAKKTAISLKSNYICQYLSKILIPGWILMFEHSKEASWWVLLIHEGKLEEKLIIFSYYTTFSHLPSCIAVFKNFTDPSTKKVLHSNYKSYSLAIIFFHVSMIPTVRKKIWRHYKSTTFFVGLFLRIPLFFYIFKILRFC